MCFINYLLLGCPVYKSPNCFPVSTPSNTTTEHINLSSITNQPSTRKRMGSSAVSDSAPDAKKSRSKLASRKIPSKCKKFMFLHISYSQNLNLFVFFFYNSLCLQVHSNNLIMMPLLKKMFSPHQ